MKVTGRYKDILAELAANYGIDVDIFGIARKGLVNMCLEFAHRQARLFRIIKHFKPDVILTAGGPYISSLGKLFNVPTYIFYDTENATLSNLLAYPFATCVYLPSCYGKPVRWRNVRHNSYHELAYLHPNHFKPDPTVLDELGLKKNELFTIVRFVGWAAVHDIGRRGFTNLNKIKAVKAFERFGRVFVSSEGDLPEELEAYRYPLDPCRMHDLMSFASMLFGESASMASEAAVLGVPSIFMDAVGRGYCFEQEKAYGLVFNLLPDRQEEAIEKGIEILSNFQRDHWQAKRKRLLEDKMDLSDIIYQVAISKPFSGRRKDSNTFANLVT